MRVRLAKEDINSNYKVSLSDISKEKDFIKILEDYSIQYKKTEYFKDFFMYKLLNINSKFIMILQEKASNYIKYIEPVSIYSLPLQIDDENGEIPVIYPEKNKNYITLGVIDNGIAHIKYLDPWIKRVHTRFLKKDTSATHGTFVSGIALYGDKLENREIVKNELDIPIMIDGERDNQRIESLLKELRKYVTGRISVVIGANEGDTKEKLFELGVILGKNAEIINITTGNPGKDNEKRMSNEILAGVRTTEARGYIDSKLDRKQIIELILSKAEKRDYIVLLGIRI